MNQEKINGFQLFSVIFLFELGSAILVGLAADAQQDAWMSVILATGLGCILYLVYTKLARMYPSKNLIQYLQSILGTFPGWLIGLAYVVYFIYIASRVLRDFEELLVITDYRSSTLLTIGIIMVICVMYAAYQGLEVFFRIAELCFFIIVFMLLSLVIFEIASQIMKWHHFLPVLEHGWRPVFKSVFPSTLTFPFGELIAFTMLLPSLNKQDRAKKAGLIAIALSGLFLTLFTIMNIAILGANVIERSAFPFLTAGGYIDISHFVQRLDIVVIICMVILGFVKIAVYFYCAMIGTAQLFKMKDRKKTIYPIGVSVLISSLIIAPTYIHHIYEGVKIVPYYLHLPLQIAVPVLLLIIGWIRQKT
ncbi:GerAB/ArcD/ProY family transporter [Paenibacillus rhizovicinus]|uniref:GerAB/ArcD/ProY family transporter n=1 Tax=Paenibacillus rhizovicinus TaxID=2704463 RepID=A0A6C0NY15_9BACL|nr:GerAB/ArcD/ProY family transporter [Paenibacillus rhizovicinus]QHW31120.1 GerAB/ArcD/ProY family transporter [Paenibacillus rhizovicinus]